MLSALILVPLFGAALIGFWPTGINGKLSRGIALVIASIAFLWSVILAIQFHPAQITQQFTEFLPWVEVLGLNYNLGVDGLSLPLLVLTGSRWFILTFAGFEWIVDLHCHLQQR